MEEGDGTCTEVWTIQEQVPLHVVPVRETTVEDNARNTPQGLWKAPSEEAPAAGNFCALVSSVYCVESSKEFIVVGQPTSAALVLDCRDVLYCANTCQLWCVWGIRGLLRVTSGIMWQGEPRDSSDEEWEAAYAALDPVAQIGWGNRRAEGNEVGAQLVRDVFEAADEMHDNAMSEMEGNTQVEDVPDNVGASPREDRPSLLTDRIVDPLDGMDVSQEGENSLPKTWIVQVLGYLVSYNSLLGTSRVSFKC